MEEEFPKPVHAALRRFRVSRPEASYFITAHIARGSTGLDRPSVTARILEEWGRLEAEQTWIVLTGVVMPDHVHLLVQLGKNRTLVDSMRLFRSRLSPTLRDYGLDWQRGFYAHRLRRPEEVTPVVFYIYLNPYRAGLVNRTEAWPGYFCRSEEWAWFGGLTANAAPQPEWLR